MRFIIALGFLALSACGSSEERTKIGDVEFTTNERSGRTEISTKDGSLSVIEGPAAEKINPPAYAPKYPGSTILSAMINASEGSAKHYTLNFTTTDSLDKIATFYREQFAAQGLKIGMNMVTEEAVMINADKDERTVSVVVSIVEGKINGILSYKGDEIPLKAKE